MHDYVATFYGGYNQVARQRLYRVRVPWITVAVGVAAVSLIALVAADVSAYSDRPAIVQVTSVNWYGEGYLLTTGPGFSTHAGQSILFPLTCSSLCLPWDGASVSSPFQLVSFAVTYHSLQYTNVTVRAPSAGYDGPLSIILDVD